MVGPALVLSQSITAIITKIKASDWGGAFNELLNIPANMTNAFLNGGPTLDLTSLIPKLGLPSQVKTLGLALIESRSSSMLRVCRPVQSVR